jgi:EAL domain-containing protein (putative c-di-GMP-specific phosphodiesterase class I)
MYVAKREGKNHFRYCSSLMKNRVSAQNQIRNQLFQAMGRNELELHYQPKVDLKTQAIVGVEALLRWRLGQKTLISPAKFIPIAEETGLIVLMGTWVLRQALLQLKRWHEQGFTQLTMAVNLSARQLRDAAFAEQALAVINESGLLASQIELEITESIAFARDKAIVSNIDRLKAQRFMIAIDDFGTEYSSLINMKLVSFDCLKIPKDFISGIGKNAKDEAIVSSIIELTRKLRIKVIAEGVERLEEVAFLRNAGCDEIQGFYFYRPMEAKKIEALLHESRNCGSSLVGSDVN